MKHDHANSPLSARAAMEDVLQAERDSMLAIEAARSEAQAIVARATEEAQRIVRRCESRIQRMHERCALALERELQGLHPTDAPVADESVAEPATRAEIDAAVTRLAASLTSAGP